jgi:hypothetical protein
MAKRETVVFTCDLHDDEVTEGVETVTFGLDGNSYEVDACADHQAELRDAFATYVGAAHPAVGRRGPRAGPAPAGAAARTARRSSASGSGPARTATR